MRRSKRMCVGCLCVFLSLLLSGCNLIDTGIGNLLQPPKMSSVQAAVQTALEDYLRANFEANTASSYTLKFPQRGAYRTAVILQDVDGNGVNEALVLYTPTPDSTIHVQYLCQNEDGWRTAGDVDTGSIEVREIVFEDVIGSNRKEAFVGLGTGSSRESRLLLLSLSDAELTQIGSFFYDTLLLKKVTARERADILLLRLASGDRSATAQLLGEQNGKLSELGTAYLDTRIQSFGRVSTAERSNCFEIYVDGLRSDGGTVTDLLCWNGDQLTTPFRATDGTALVDTYRASGLANTDIDNDGNIEWPLSTELPSDGTEQQRLWLTSWYRWNHETQQAVKKLSTVVNQTDGYFLKVEEEWAAYITALYDEQLRTMRFVSWHGGDTTEFLCIAFCYSESNTPALPEGWEGETVPLQNGGILQVQYREGVLSVTLDDILYRLGEIQT